MPNLLTLSAIIILLITFLTGCGQTYPIRSIPSSTVDQIPISTLQSADAYPLNNDEILTVSGYPYSPVNLSPTQTILPTTNPTYPPTGTPTPTLTPTLITLDKTLPAPLYFINWAEGNQRQIWRLEPDGSSTTQITHEEYGVTDLDVAGDGRLAYLSNNTLIVTDALGGQRKVLVQGEPLPVWNDQWSEWAKNTTLFFEDAKGNSRVVFAKDEPRVWNDVLGQKVVDDNFIWLTIPIWSPDSSQIAFGWDAAWLANPDSGELIRVTEQRTDEKRRYQFTYIPIGWTPDGKKLILNILPPRSGHGGEGPNWGLGFVDPQQDSIPINPGTLDCCEYSMLRNGQVLLGGMNGAGLWMIDPKTGKKQSLLPEQDPQKPPKFPSIRWPKQSPDKGFLFFDVQGTEADLFYVLKSVDEKHLTIEHLRDATLITPTELDWLHEALWSEDASIVLITDNNISLINTR